MRKPDFFIIGAPKCGTTSLSRWLEEHPQIFMSPIKEPHYYSTDLGNRTVKSAKQYAKLFQNAKEYHKAVGEASTWYLYSKEAVANIERTNPGAKYIVMTREPADMAYSLYLHNFRVTYENERTFEAAWRLQEIRAAGNSIPRSCPEPDMLKYYSACALGSLLQVLLDKVPQKRILLLSLEDVSKDPAGHYRCVLQFLDVEDDNRSSFPVANASRQYRSRLFQKILKAGAKARQALGIMRGLQLAKLNERNIFKPSLPEDFLEEINETFSKERKLLASLKAELMQRVQEK
ncbi:MAG: sulfotransferase [Chlorobiales bacterium]|nr:sulfotransferase [Chlorobiales bacterium]